MKEFICECCGKKAIATKKGGKVQKYCSKECREKAANARYGWSGDRCLHNDWVICTIHKCENCGWNPAVKKMRKETLYEKQT